ncbi:MAG: type I-U CRISPR-associated protein Cas5/Cas6 [Gemmataceae bacterium]|nr:type I-U CRISPR-associated protein Cas5/Cas6 [Gemmataceae bacterium]
MSSAFCLTVRFLDPVPSFHGKGDGEEPEWPPSPLRLFQALVAAAAARWRESQFAAYARPAFKWLEIRTPTVVASSIQAERNGYRMYVPNNAGDLVTSAWARGNIDAKFSSLNVEKDVRPTRLVGGDCVHYVWQLAGPQTTEVQGHLATLSSAACSITHLGWGIDMVAANAVVISEEEAAKLVGQRWRPTDDPMAAGYRVPIKGTFDALVSKHESFLNRLGANGFKPVPPLSAFGVLGYHCATDFNARHRPQRPWCAFQILNPETSGNRAFDTPRRCRDVAAWARHATGSVCEGWAFGSTEGFVHGHEENGQPLKGELADQRFMYLPLPTINHALNRVESIRRVLIAAPLAFQNRIDWIRRRLPGQDLVSINGEVVSVLNLLSTSDWVLKQYTSESRDWSTVTPVIMPGHDDHDSRKAEAILRKAFVQSGLAQELVDGIEELEWRAVGFRAGLDLAHRYLSPENLKGRKYHVRVRFAHPVRGPLAVGAGRYRGFGLFATEL